MPVHVPVALGVVSPTPRVPLATVRVRRVDVGRVTMPGVSVAGVGVPAMLDVNAVGVAVTMSVAVMTETVGKAHRGHHNQPQETRDQENRIDQRRPSPPARVRI